jgi:acyl dehydratase
VPRYRSGADAGQEAIVAEESLITQEMKDSIGVESEPWTVEVDRTSVRMFARSVGQTDPVFYDEDEAKRRGYRSLPAPPAYLGTTVFHPASSDSTFGGPRGGRRQARTSLKRVLNGGTEVEYFGDICAGDRLTARSKIADISQRTGGIGTMLITVNETSYTNQDGKLVAVMRGTGIQY